MKINQGTPKTLTQAILNGLDDAKEARTQEERCRCVELHVLDFIAQKFSPPMLCHHSDSSITKTLRTLAVKIGLKNPSLLEEINNE